MKERSYLKKYPHNITNYEVNKMKKKNKNPMMKFSQYCTLLR